MSEKKDIDADEEVSHSENDETHMELLATLSRVELGPEDKGISVNEAKEVAECTPPRFIQVQVLASADNPVPPSLPGAFPNVASIEPTVTSDVNNLKSEGVAVKLEGEETVKGEGEKADLPPTRPIVFQEDKQSLIPDSSYSCFYENRRGALSPNVQKKDDYDEGLKKGVANRACFKGSYVVANWGISSKSHQAVQNPSLLQLSLRAVHPSNMGPVYAHLFCAGAEDEGGSVVRYLFSPEAQDRDIVEFASALHARLVAELLYKAPLRPGDQIVVYYHCKTAGGFFEHKSKLA